MQYPIVPAQHTLWSLSCIVPSRQYVVYIRMCHLPQVCCELVQVIVVECMFLVLMSYSLSLTFYSVIFAVSITGISAELEGKYF